jgi:hypothetical protein
MSVHASCFSAFSSPFSPQDRLMFGVERPLCELMRVATMTPRNARTLYEAGVVDVPALARASAAAIAGCLHAQAPFQSDGTGRDLSFRCGVCFCKTTYSWTFSSICNQSFILFIFLTRLSIPHNECLAASLSW